MAVEATRTAMVGVLWIQHSNRKQEFIGSLCTSRPDLKTVVKKIARCIGEMCTGRTHLLLRDLSKITETTEKLAKIEQAHTAAMQHDGTDGRNSRRVLRCLLEDAHMSNTIRFDVAMLRYQPARDKACMIKVMRVDCLSKDGVEHVHVHEANPDAKRGSILRQAETWTVRSIVHQVASRKLALSTEFIGGLNELEKSYGLYTRFDDHKITRFEPEAMSSLSRAINSPIETSIRTHCLRVLAEDIIAENPAAACTIDAVTVVDLFCDHRE